MSFRKESTHRLLAEPLLSGRPHPRCCAIVVVPARNEELTLPYTLDALRLQRNRKDSPFDQDLFEVIVLINNCTDSTEFVAAAYQEAHPNFRLHVVTRTLAPNVAFVGTARRLLMDTAYYRLRACAEAHPDNRRQAILSTDADTVVAPHWIANNLAALEAGADVVGGVIHLFPEDLELLEANHPAIHRAYCRDRELQRLVAQLESVLDPDPADPWPRHLENFGASLACTPDIYAASGGLPPERCLEDVAFIKALRRAGACIRHCPDTHIFTSARLDGRAEVGLSGQLRHWQQESDQALPHIVDSAEWIEHNFRSLVSLRRLNNAKALPALHVYPQPWRDRISECHAKRLSTQQFLEELSSGDLISELFEALSKPRHAEITDVLIKLSRLIGEATLQSRSTAKFGVAAAKVG